MTPRTDQRRSNACRPASPSRCGEAVSSPGRGDDRAAHRTRRHAVPPGARGHAGRVTELAVSDVTPTRACGSSTGPPRQRPNMPRAVPRRAVDQPLTASGNKPPSNGRGDGRPMRRPYGRRVSVVPGWSGLQLVTRPASQQAPAVWLLGPRPEPPQFVDRLADAGSPATAAHAPWYHRLGAGPMRLRGVGRSCGRRASPPCSPANADGDITTARAPSRKGTP